MSGDKRREWGTDREEESVLGTRLVLYGIEFFVGSELRVVGVL